MIHAMQSQSVGFDWKSHFILLNSNIDFGSDFKGVGDDGTDDSTDGEDVFTTTGQPDQTNVTVTSDGSDDSGAGTSNAVTAATQQGQSSSVSVQSSAPSGAQTVVDTTQTVAAPTVPVTPAVPTAPVLPLNVTPPVPTPTPAVTPSKLSTYYTDVVNYVKAHPYVSVGIVALLLGGGYLAFGGKSAMVLAA
jgi:hypothetical protein